MYIFIPFYGDNCISQGVLFLFLILSLQRKELFRPLNTICVQLTYVLDGNNILYKGKSTGSHHTTVPTNVNQENGQTTFIRHFY